MKTGFQGAFVISWSQTDVDGLEDAPFEALTLGAAWSWHGAAVQVGESNDPDQANEDASTRKALSVVRTSTQGDTDLNLDHQPETPMDHCFVVTNGAQSFTVAVVDAGPKSGLLLTFINDLPPKNTDFWVAHLPTSTLAVPAGETAVGDVIGMVPCSRKLVRGLR